MAQLLDWKIDLYYFFHFLLKVSLLKEKARYLSPHPAFVQNHHKANYESVAAPCFIDAQTDPQVAVILGKYFKMWGIIYLLFIDLEL